MQRLLEEDLAQDATSKVHSPDCAINVNARHDCTCGLTEKDELPPLVDPSQCTLVYSVNPLQQAIESLNAHMQRVEARLDALEKEKEK